MKTLFKYYAYVLVSAMLILTSCEPERTIFEGPYHVRFDAATATLKENVSTPYTVKMHYVGPKPTQAIEMTVAIEGGEEGADFEMVGGPTLTIPAGEYSTSFEIAPIDNVQSTGNKNVTFTITSVSGGIASGLGLVGKSFTAVIEDDDCPLALADFIGTLSCNEPGYGDYDVSVAVDPGVENRLIISNFWDYPQASIYVDFDPSSNIITVPDQTIGLNSAGSPLRVVGSGEYSACNTTFSYDYTVYRTSDNAVFDTNTHTYTK